MRPAEKPKDEIRQPEKSRGTDLAEAPPAVYFYGNMKVHGGRVW
jgi:hypothetical protein